MAIKVRKKKDFIVELRVSWQKERLHRTRGATDFSPGKFNFPESRKAKQRKGIKSQEKHHCPAVEGNDGWKDKWFIKTYEMSRIPKRKIRFGQRGCFS